MQKLSMLKAQNQKLWVVIGVAGVLILAGLRRRRRRIRAASSIKEDFGAFVVRLEHLPSSNQPPHPAAPLPLSGLTFAVDDHIDIKGYVSGDGSTDWKRARAASAITAMVVTRMLCDGATCVGKTVTGELGFGLLGGNINYGTPVNPQNPCLFPGGSSSGSAVAVAAHLVDFALGMDTVGGIRVPASFCGIIGFRPSHGSVPAYGVSPNSHSLDTVGCLASDPSVLHRLGHALLQLNPLEHKKTRYVVIADDLFRLSKFPVQKTVHAIRKALMKLSVDYQTHIDFEQYIASHVPSIRGYSTESNPPAYAGMHTLKALSTAMLSLQSFEFKRNHEGWIRSVDPMLSTHVSNQVWAALNLIPQNPKYLREVRMEMRAALKSLLKDDGILITPTVSDPPPKVNSEQGLQVGFFDRMHSLLSIASLSGACEVTFPFGTHDGSKVSISFIASHGNDKLLLDTVLDMLSSHQEVGTTSRSLPLPNIDGAAELAPTSSSLLLPKIDGNVDAAECLKEKGDDAFKEKRWNEAASYYTEAIKLDETNANYCCKRAAAYLEMRSFLKVEEDCSLAISLDKTNVQAYLTRGAARQSALLYRIAIQDFEQALYLEPHNKTAIAALKGLQKFIK